jgi:peptidylprolyl isomerase
LVQNHHGITLKERDMSDKEEKLEVEEEAAPEEQTEEETTEETEVEKKEAEEEEVEKEEVPSEPAEEKPKKAKKTSKKKTKKTKKKEEPEEDIVTKGDFVLLEITGRTLETDDVFETTDEELAREEGIHEDNRSYGPRLVVVGEGWVLKGLDDRLEGQKIESPAEVEIPPEEAFGERSPDDVRTVPFRILRSKGVNPVVGQQVELDGRTAMVRSVGAGRVQLDYNHPLAGRRIVYHVKIAKRYEEDTEKIKALIGRRFLGVDVDSFKLKMLKKKVRIEIPDEVFFGENIQLAKRGVALDIQKYFPDIDEVEYTETIRRSA